MSPLAHLLSQTATRLRPTVNTDAAGAQVEAGTTAAAYACRLERRSTSTGDVAGGTVETGSWVLYLAPDADVKASDRVEVDGVEYEVIGDPHPVQSPRGTHHVEVDLELRTEVAQ